MKLCFNQHCIYKRVGVAQFEDMLHNIEVSGPAPGGVAFAKEEGRYLSLQCCRIICITDCYRRWNYNWNYSTCFSLTHYFIFMLLSRKIIDKIILLYIEYNRTVLSLTFCEYESRNSAPKCQAIIIFAINCRLKISRSIFKDETTPHVPANFCSYKIDVG